MNNIDLDEMSRDELLVLQAEIKEQLKNFRPYRIKQRVISCGKPDCWCAEGVDGHGPYLYATYRQDGKTVKMSLGPYEEEWEMAENKPDFPKVFDYLTTPDYKYQSMTRAQSAGWVYLVLSDDQFFNRYGVYKDEDNFSRAEKFWGTKKACEQYEIDCRLVADLRALEYNPWSGYGVSTLEAVSKLGQLEASGYYLVA